MSWLWLCARCRHNLCYHHGLCMLHYGFRFCICRNYHHTKWTVPGHE